MTYKSAAAPTRTTGTRSQRMNVARWLGKPDSSFRRVRPPCSAGTRGGRGGSRSRGRGETRGEAAEQPPGHPLNSRGTAVAFPAVITESPGKEAAKRPARNRGAAASAAWGSHRGGCEKPSRRPRENRGQPPDNRRATARLPRRGLRRAG